jgi:hypothetical protein
MARPRGSLNRSTLAREAKAKADIAAALAKAKTAGRADPKAAMDEMYKAIAIAEGFAAKLRPRDIQQDQHGIITIMGGDINLFGAWFDRWHKCIELLAKYQLPPIKAMDAPTPPPDPEQSARDSKIVFGLRVFEGGKPVQPLQPLDEDEDE